MTNITVKLLLKAECVQIKKDKNLLSKPNCMQYYFFTGVIYTKEPNLDREAKSMYEIVVQAKDAPGFSGDSSTATVIISLSDINDNFPVFKHRECHTALSHPETRGWHTHNEFSSQASTTQLSLKTAKKTFTCSEALLCFSQSHFSWGMHT